MDGTSDVSQAVAGAESGDRLGREDWIRVALQTLIDAGVERVKVLPLSARLGVTRGSFYWHFKNRAALLDALIERWERQNTDAILGQAALGGNDITAAILNVFECWVDDRLFDPKLDFAVREWARRSPQVRAIVEQEDEKRVAGLARMFARAGYGRQEAFVRARVLYYMQIGYYALDVRESLERRLSLVRDYLVSFSGVEPDPDLIAAYAARLLRR